MKKLFQRFVADIRKRQPFKFMKVLELCKDGYPHFHLLARTPFIEQSTEVNFGTTHQRRYRRHSQVSLEINRRLTKYITKAFTQHEEWQSMSVRQRIGTSHKFYETPKPKHNSTSASTLPRTSLDIRSRTLRYYSHFRTNQERNLHAIVDREAGDELPEELLPPRNQEW